MDACFSAKRFKSSGKTVAESKLKTFYYLDTPSIIRNNLNFAQECSNFRAGDVRLKSDSGDDVAAVFAAVCVHGFAYRIIGTHDGLNEFDQSLFLCRRH